MLVHSMGRRYFLLHYTIFISIHPFRCLLAVSLCFFLSSSSLFHSIFIECMPWPEYDFISIHSHEPRILEPRESFSIINNCSFFILTFFFSLFILSQFIGNNNYFQSNSIIRSIQLLDIVIILNQKCVNGTGTGTGTHEISLFNLLIHRRISSHTNYKLLE